MKHVIFLFAMVLAQFAIAADDDDAKAREGLVGTWRGRVHRGAKGHKLIITATRVSGTKDERQDLGEASFELNLTKKPRRMDATRTRGPQKGQTHLGIYSLKGDTLRWCVSTPGKKRPRSFSTKGSQFLLILKREKAR